MHVPIACDKFKGTFSSVEVGHAVAVGARAAGAILTVLAVADGGEGTADAIAYALGGARRTTVARDALGPDRLRPLSWILQTAAAIAFGFATKLPTRTGLSHPAFGGVSSGH